MSTTKITLSPEQQFGWRRFAAIEQLARDAGFTDSDINNTEFSLFPLFDRIVEECAKAVEEDSGCKHSAEAVRNYGKMIGNK